MPLEPERCGEVDVCVLAGLATQQPPTPDANLADFLSHAASTIGAGGSVLVPIHSNGLLFDLLEVLVTHLVALGLSGRPVYVVSPAAKAALDYANICAEWLSEARAERVLLPEYPFRYHGLIADGVVKVFPSLDAEFTRTFEEPCVVFAEHPCLRLGDAVSFMHRWSRSAPALRPLSHRPRSRRWARSSKLNTLLAVSPDTALADLLAPYQPCAMRAVHTPLDPRLSYSDAARLVGQLSPQEVVCSDLYIHPEQRRGSTRYGGAVDGADVLDLPVDCHVSAKLGQVALSKPRGLLQAGVDPDFAKTLQPVVLETGGAIVRLTARMHSVDYKNEILPPPKAEDGATAAAPAPILLGSLRAARLVDVLVQQGYRDVQATRRGDAEVVSLPQNKATITLSQGSTEIDAPDDGTLRHTLRDAVMSLLTIV